MDVVMYDGSFAGLLTVIFEIYEYKLAAPFIKKENCADGSLFGGVHFVITDPVKTKRVLLKMQSILPASVLLKLKYAFLSEEAGVETDIFYFIKRSIDKNMNIEKDYTNKHVIAVSAACHKTSREAHRMKAFIRFQRTADDLYFAIAEPDHNVLPAIAKHFKGRFSGQKWLIYDLKRKYGIYYDLENISEVNITINNNRQAETLGMALHKDEAAYQTLWKNYFTHTNIVARKNTRLHIQHLPKRYWKHLTEKIPL